MISVHDTIRIYSETPLLCQGTSKLRTQGKKKGKRERRGEGHKERGRERERRGEGPLTISSRMY